MPANEGNLRSFWFAKLPHPKTKLPTLVRVARNGQPGPADAQKSQVKQAGEWFEIRANSLADAREKAQRGGGKTWTVKSYAAAQADAKKKVAPAKKVTSRKRAAAKQVEAKESAPAVAGSAEPDPAAGGTVLSSVAVS